MKAISHTEAETVSEGSNSGLHRSRDRLRAWRSQAGGEERVLVMLAPSVPWLFPGDRSWDSSPLAVWNSIKALPTEGVAGLASRPRNLRRCFPPKLRSAYPMAHIILVRSGAP